MIRYHNLLLMMLCFTGAGVDAKRDAPDGLVSIEAEREAHSQLSAYAEQLRSRHEALHAALRSRGACALPVAACWHAAPPLHCLLLLLTCHRGRRASYRPQTAAFMLPTQGVG